MRVDRGRLRRKQVASQSNHVSTLLINEDQWRQRAIAPVNFGDKRFDLGGRANVGLDENDAARMNILQQRFEVRCHYRALGLEDEELRDALSEQRHFLEEFDRRSLPGPRWQGYGIVLTAKPRPPQRPSVTGVGNRRGAYPTIPARSFSRVRPCVSLLLHFRMKREYRLLSKWRHLR